MTNGYEFTTCINASLRAHRLKAPVSSYSVRHARKEHSQLLAILLCSIAMLSWPRLMIAANEQRYIKLVNRLGVETELSVQNINIGNELLKKVLDLPGSVLPLQVAKGVYVTLPLEEVLAVQTKQGKHVVAMRGDREMRGTLAGGLRDTENNVYGLATALALDMLNAAPPSVSEDEPWRQSPTNTYHDVWELQIPNGEPLTVVAPAFAFQYWPGSAVFWPDDMPSSAVSRSFYLKIEDQEHAANIQDFRRLALAQAADQPPHDPSIPYAVPEKSQTPMLTVVSRSGVTNSGAFILRVKDAVFIRNKETGGLTQGEGYRTIDGDWVLAAQMASDNRMRVAVSAEEWTLTRKPFRENLPNKASEDLDVGASNP